MIDDFWACMLAVLSFLLGGFIMALVLTATTTDTQTTVIQVIECPESCNACLNKLDTMEDTLNGIDDTRIEIARINYCSLESNRRLEVCK